MKYLREHFSFKNKLAFIAVVTVLAALAIVVGAVVVVESLIIKRSMQQELTALRGIFIGDAKRDFTLSDRNDIQSKLLSFRLDSTLSMICLYDAGGELIAGIARSQSDTCSQASQWESYGLIGNGFNLEQPILSGKEEVGKIFLAANSEEIVSRIGILLTIFFPVLLLTALFAMFVARKLLAKKLQDTIFDPIRELVGFAEKVSSQDSYVLRIEDSTENEIGALGKALNNLVEKFQSRVDQLRVAEERWQFALEGSQDGTWDYDCITGEVFCSDRLKKILGFSEADQPFTSFKQLQERIHKNDQALARLRLYEHMNGKSEFYNDEHRVLCKNGSYTWVLDRGQVISRGERGEPLRMIGTFQDISKRKLQEEQLRRSQKMDAIGKLSGGIAHDYNNMLGIVLGYAELLDGSNEIGAKQKTYVKEIIRAAKRSSRLTQRLLGLSAQKSSAKTVVDVNQQIVGLKNVLEKTLTARIRLELKLEEKLLPVYLDGSDLEDAIINLCINAKHAMDDCPQYEKVLTIETASEVRPSDNMSSNSWVLLSISDTGCGMDAATKAQIFDPFYSTKGDKGTGLGLSQVYGFVQRSGGTISVDSEVGKGATITIYFPAYRGEVAKVDQGEHHGVVPSGKIFRKENILVVDDELELLKLTCEILQQHRYTVWPANNSQQALSILESQPIDLLLTDVIMPDMNGYQLSSIIKAQYPDVRIKMMSGFSDQEKTVSNDIYDGEIEVIHKPFSSDTLLRKVAEVFEVEKC